MGGGEKWEVGLKGVKWINGHVLLGVPYLPYPPPVAPFPLLPFVMGRTLGNQVVK